MFELLKKLRSNKSNGVADLRKALEQIDIKALEAEISVTGKARADALFVSEAAVEVAEKRHVEAVRNLERGRILRDELTSRLREAEDAEADVALTRHRNRVAEEGIGLERAITTEWPALQRKMVEILKRENDFRAACHDINERLTEAGRSDFVDCSRWTMGAAVKLPSDDELHVEGWGR